MTASLAQHEATGEHSHQVFQAVLENLRQRIHHGEWSPGTRLPSITQLARELDIGIGSMREVLRSLQSIGLVKIEHGRGVFVIGSETTAPPPRTSQEIDIRLIVALTETRRILEPELVALAAERGTAEELSEISALAMQMAEHARQGLDFIEPDIQFHHRIVQAAHNPILYQIFESLSDLLTESRKIISAEPGMTVRSIRYHLLIAEMLTERNSTQARLLMLAHMNDALSSVVAIEKIHKLI